MFDDDGRDKGKNWAKRKNSHTAGRTVPYPALQGREASGELARHETLRQRITVFKTPRYTRGDAEEEDERRFKE
jgi:hypothetical protein